MTLPLEVIEAVELQDMDALLGFVERCCSTSQWDSLLELRSRCQEATQRGRQLWGVDEHIRYRLALQSPPSYAGPAVSEGTTRFTLGPLAEVAASANTWEQIDPYLAHGPTRATVAAERVVRGESVNGEISDLPGALQDWEPAYPVATYHPDRVETPSPPLPNLAEIELTQARPVITDADSEDALADLVAPWVTESNGRCQVVAVEGDHLTAISSLGLRKARIGHLSTSEALAWLAWAGASGGAHGRRRGMAAGRYGAWWTIAALADQEWPPDPNAIGEAAASMTWVWFDDGAPGTGWEFRLAASDPESDLAWAIAALDQAD